MHPELNTAIAVIDNGVISDNSIDAAISVGLAIQVDSAVVCVDDISGNVWFDCLGLVIHVSMNTVMVIVEDVFDDDRGSTGRVRRARCPRNPIRNRIFAVCNGKTLDYRAVVLAGMKHDPNGTVSRASAIDGGILRPLVASYGNGFTLKVNIFSIGSW